MLKRRLGKSSIEVSVLGFGAGQIGDIAIEDCKVENILNSVLDNGINLIDTARGYYSSEERIGKFISHRRDEFILSTKVGYGIEGFQDWSYEIIEAGINEALRILKTDYIDIVFLHSCPSDVIINNGLMDAMDKAVESGKIKIAGYSGENEDLKFAIDTNRFGCIQTSINLFDQRGINNLLPAAIDNNIGIIGKRTLANAPWRFTDQPSGEYCENYWHRMREMNLKFDLPWDEVALRFALYSSGATSSLIGTTNQKHLEQNINLADKGALPDDIVDEIRKSFLANDKDWFGQV